MKFNPRYRYYLTIDAMITALLQDPTTRHSEWIFWEDRLTGTSGELRNPNYVG